VNNLQHASLELGGPNWFIICKSNWNSHHKARFHLSWSN